MFVITRDVSAAKKVIATLLATAMVLWASGLFSNTARAANITDVSDLLTDSAPGASSDHTISFTTPTGVGSTETIDITFPSEFTGTSSILFSDVELTVQGGAAETIVAGAPGAAQWGFSWAGDVMTLTAGASESIPALASSTIVIGLSAGGANQIVNPSSPTGGNESYEISISAGTSDSGHTRVVILDTVLVTASVLTVFDFTVYGNATTTAVNGTTTTRASASTSIPFGVLTAGEIETLSQDLTVATNAINGFVVTVETDGPFESSTGADIDYFDDGATSTTPAAWSTPDIDIADNDTWGHWGVTSEDATTTRTNEFGSNEWVGIGTAPVVIFSHDGPADEVTAGIGSTTVGYQVETTALQEAGDDYETVLTYIATPTF